MAMVKVKVRVRVTAGSVRNEEFETTLDSSAVSEANCDSGRAKLNPWAKNFFPTADKVEVTQVIKL